MTAGRQPLTSKERTARHRARKRDGVLVVDGVEVSAHATEILVKHGLASPEEITDKKRLSDIVSDFLDCWDRGTLFPTALMQLALPMSAFCQITSASPPEADIASAIADFRL